MFNITTNPEKTKQYYEVLFKSVKFGNSFRIIRVDNSMAKSH